MKIGDMVKKRWGKIEPEEMGTIGLVVCTGRPGKNWSWSYIRVAYSFGVRYFRSTELEVICNEM